MFKSRSIRGLRRDFLGDIPLRYKEGEEARRGSNEKRTVKHGEGGEALGVDGEFRGWIAAGKRTRRHPVRLLLLASPPHTAVISTPRCTPPSTDPPTCLPGLHIIQLTHKTNNMRLLLLPLLGLVLGGESLETLRAGLSVTSNILHLAKPVVLQPGFVKGFKTPSFSPSHFSISEDHKPPSESSKPSRSDEDLKSSSFDEAKITRLFDTLAPHPDRNPVCNVLPNPGTCRAALPRYYLDPETGTCNCYLYGGCTEDGAGESPGSFFTLEECQRVCRPPNMAEGPVCKDIFKEDDFVSFLVEPLPPKNTKTDHLSNKEFDGNDATSRSLEKASVNMSGAHRDLVAASQAPEQ
ncbi:hypothetical protein O3P69_003086 [Scylla paramamosain]|uniref:BPTI/Kunitz inhibitor domain-containing protein n=1 Tax=Scylla paramamosain TaxID=85552 RepID=A0AAW0UJ19_SCYPA